jgi:hypothetical protein
MTDMVRMWKDKINGIRHEIMITAVGDEERLEKLYRNEHYLNVAFLRCLGEKI